MYTNAVRGSRYLVYVIIISAFTYLYILSHTCTFCHIPVHFVTYLYILSHTCTFCHIPVHFVRLSSKLSTLCLGDIYKDQTHTEINKQGSYRQV